MGRLNISTIILSVVLMTLSLSLLIRYSFYDSMSMTGDWESISPKRLAKSISRWRRPQEKSTLALTLEHNEGNYQQAVIERQMLIDQLGGPEIPAFPEPHSALYTLWDFFIPAFSCPFSTKRVGVLGDGGKWVCGYERALSEKPKGQDCVVYSMGVEGQSSFEVAILEQYEHCEVFGFDYSVRNWGPEMRARPDLMKRAHFHPYLIGAEDNHDVTPAVYSLQGIMQEQGHEFVDILKMDIEGSEFSTLADLVESFNGEPLPFGQLQLEVHFGYTENMDTVGDFDEWWKILEKGGLRPFWTEPNLMHANNYRESPSVSEWSFINVKGRHALITDVNDSD